MQIEELKKQNYDLYLKEKELQNEICQSRPIMLSIVATSFCNLNCIMCLKNTRSVNNPIIYNLKNLRFFGKAFNRLNNFRLAHSKYATMDFGLFEKVANETFPYLTEVNPTIDGEPFLTKDFYKQLNLIERFKVRLYLFSNATTLPRGKKLERFINNLGHFVISFDAAHKATYEKIRRFAKYEQVIANIKRFNKARKQIKGDKKPHLTFRIVLMRSNIEELADWVRLAKDLEVDSVAAAHVAIFDKRLLKESLIYHKDLANYHIEMARKLAEKLKVNIKGFPALYSESIDSKQPSGLDNRMPCYNLWAGAIIELDGTVSPCCASNKEGLFMGNIKEETFDQIWNGPRYRALRRSFKTGNILNQCKDCYIRIGTRSSDNKNAFILSS